MSRIGRGTTTTFEQDDAFAGLRQHVRDREAGDPTADDDHIGLGLVSQPGVLRKGADVDQYGVLSLFAMAIVDSFYTGLRGS